MYFKFSRSFHYDPGYHVEGHTGLKNWNVYKIWQDQGWAGHLYYHKKIGFFEYEDQEFGFIPQMRSRIIVNRKTNKVIGEIKREAGNKIGKIRLTDGTYTAVKLDPDVKPSLLKPDSWDHHKYSIYKADAEVVYTFSFQPFFKASVSPLTDGFISLEGDNLILLFSGIVLLQMVFDFQDSMS